MCFFALLRIIAMYHTAAAGRLNLRHVTAQSAIEDGFHETMGYWRSGIYRM